MVYNKCKIRNMLPIFNQLLNLLIWFLYTTVYILATYTTQQQITDIQIIGTFTLCTIHTVTILIIHTLYHSYCNNINCGKQLVSATQHNKQLFIDPMNSTKKIKKVFISIKAWKKNLLLKSLFTNAKKAYCIVKL